MTRHTRQNVVDSSAWLAYLADESGAAHFSAAIEDVEDLVVPAICILEVVKVVSLQRGDGDALQAVALMQQGLVIDLDATLAMAAAKTGTAHKLPLADSIVYATGLTVDGVVWTQDEDFDGLPDVKFFAKSKRA